jgi:nitrate/nitrite transporter NarK
MVSSAGMHLLMPATASIALGLSDETRRGRALGRLGAVETLGSMMGTSLIWVFFSASGTRHMGAFIISAMMAACAAALYAFMHIPHLHQRRARLVIRRKYWLYYLLESLFGARKQIFITFGFWVLVEVYGQEARGIAQLLFTASCIGLFFKPTVGLIIDRFGERTVMIADGLLLSVVCVGYGYAMHFTADAEQALWVARICFVCDNLLFSLGTGRAVYLSRVADTPQDLTSTLAMGVSVNHVASMTIPMIAGAAWEVYGYERVFLAAAVLALTASAAASLVPRRRIAQ